MNNIPPIPISIATGVESGHHLDLRPNEEILSKKRNKDIGGIGVRSADLPTTKNLADRSVIILQNIPNSKIIAKTNEGER